ncbi:MAG: hypothetical protein ACKOAX_11705 [Candidatus Kapaibacterium sp.]
MLQHVALVDDGIELVEKLLIGHTGTPSKNVQREKKNWLSAVEWEAKLLTFPIFVTDFSTSWVMGSKTRYEQ